MSKRNCLSAFMVACAMMLIPMSTDAANTLIPKDAVKFQGKWQEFHLKDKQNNRHMIEIREAGELSMELQAYSGMNYVRLFDGDMVKLYDKDLNGSKSNPATAEIDFDLLPGVYYLQYECANGANAEGEYRIKAEFSAAANNETEPNDTFNKAMKLEINKPVTGFLTRNLGVGIKSTNVDTVDYYSFVVDKDQKMKITYTPEKKNGLFELVNASMIPQRRQTVSESPYVCEMKLKAGTYYISISNRNVSNLKETGSGKYTLLVEPEVKDPQVGDVYTDADTGIKYRVTSLRKNAATASFIELTNKEALSAVVPGAIKVGDVTMKVTAVADEAFAGCKKLQTVSVGENVTKIGKRAFSGCTSLTTVKGAQKVTAIGAKAFYKCTSLRQVGSAKNKITLMKVKTIGKLAFAGCTSIKKVNIPSSDLVRIYPSAFSKCSSLTNVTIASGKMTTIGKNAFKGCTKLKKAVIKSTKLNAVGTKAFYGVSGKCVIKLPGAKVKAYKKLFTKDKMGTKVKVKKI